MRIWWSAEARDDVDRLADFIAIHDPNLADEIEHDLSQAPKKLLEFPRRGARLSDFDPREVREFSVANYRLRYEIAEAGIIVLRIFHVRENRR